MIARYAVRHVEKVSRPWQVVDNYRSGEIVARYKYLGAALKRAQRLCLEFPYPDNGSGAETPPGATERQGGAL